ncbi:ADP-ribosylglycohydrolase family protein [Carboxydothermus ferrireducens]|uniref:ADP-ribosyl-[dinitrogen reductase] hydrolase n=1 Tax=Carboxydothermus ferrireducens DSM 11255 TaxID=1119529 RepID=A0ABX2RFX9_9THEO|nr:ADP-ribosylglycohydrolase family protein [Carboxydothermus ferrireducens]NYE58733.1 ADP-ribosyl-[dinitrogen reductase] hydrolase [Carboxydothermus ferrireducens DSM 11255]
MKEKYTGCLLGFYLGDALGVTLENMEEKEIRNKYGVFQDIAGGGPFNLPPGEGSDETIILTKTAEAILQDPENPFPYLLEELQKEISKRPELYGIATRTSLEAYGIFGADLEKIENYLISKLGERLCGNGSLPRIIPTALFYGDDEVYRQYALILSRLTHPHPVTDYLVVFCGFFLKELLQTKNRLKAYEEALKKSDFYLKRETLAQARASRERLYRLSYLNACDLKTGGFVTDTVEAAVYIFLAEDNPLDIIVKSANLGGDADSRAALAGALAGIYYGRAKLPEELLKKLTQPSHLEQLGELLWVKKW